MQVGELLQLADSFDDEDATRVFVCHQSPVDEGFMSQLASRLKVCASRVRQRGRARFLNVVEHLSLPPLPPLKTDILLYDAPAAPCPTNYYNVGVHDRDWGHDMSVQYVVTHRGMP